MCVSWHHEANARSHSVCTDDGDAAYTPRHQTHPETSPIHTHRGQWWDRQHIPNICLSGTLLTWLLQTHPVLYYNGVISSLSVSHLEMVNVLLCIQVYASGSLLYGHDRQADIYTAMQLSFLNLTQTWRSRLILWKKYFRWTNTVCIFRFLCHYAYVYGGLGVLQDPIIQNKESLHLKTTKKQSWYCRL